MRVHLPHFVFHWQGLLDDTAISLLWDDRFEQLDLSYCQMSGQQILQTLSLMPELRHLSLLGYQSASHQWARSDLESVHQNYITG